MRFFGRLFGGRLDGDEFEIVGTERSLVFEEMGTIEDTLAHGPHQTTMTMVDAERSAWLPYTYASYAKRERRGKEIVMVRAYVAPGVRYRRPRVEGTFE